MIKEVVREHHWLPNEIGSLFIDSQDYLGLVYWSQDVRDVYKKSKSQ